MKGLLQAEKMGKCEPKILNIITNIDSCALKPLRLAIRISDAMALQEKSTGWLGDWLHFGLRSPIRKLAVR
jgi:hypothetical protein